MFKDEYPNRSCWTIFRSYGLLHAPDDSGKCTEAYDITVKMPNVHGAPVQMGNPEEVGVMDVMKPDYGEAVDIYEGEIPVFWPCGVTPQAAIENAKLPIVITHAPGHMFITDILNSELNDYLEAQKNK